MARTMQSILLTALVASSGCAVSDETQAPSPAPVDYTEAVLSEATELGDLEVQNGFFVFDRDGKLRKMSLWLSSGDVVRLGTEPDWHGNCDLIVESPWGDVAKEPGRITENEQYVLLEFLGGPDGSIEAQLQWDYLLER